MTTTDLGEHLQADELVREAYEAVHRYPQDFPGYRAAVLFSTERGSSRGAVAVRPGRDPELTIDAAEADRRWLSQELGSLAGHRWHRSYEDADGRLAKTLGADEGHPLGRLVELDDAMRSTYRVLDGRITEISRTADATRFTIVIQERMAAADGGAVSTQFTVAYWDLEAGRLTRSDVYSDAYVELEGVLLPCLRRVVTAADDGLTARQMRLSAHELLGEEGG